MSGKWTSGPWRSQTQKGWGREPVIIADAWPGPLAKMIAHPDEYYRHKKIERGEETITTFDPETEEGGRRKAEVREELNANAHLIAAAPELYECLEAMVDDDPCRFDHTGFCQTHTNEDDEGNCVVAKALKVLAKARDEGEEP